jgi:cobalt/nickel transport system permease protein
MEPLIVLMGWMISIAIIYLSLRIVNKRIDDRQIPLLAILAAGIFVAQMINFPIGGGTSGHLVGAALAAIILGPYSAIIVLAAILVIQSLLFGDGGVTALGLNILNMGIIGSFSGWFIYRIISKKYKGMGIFIASWTSVVLASLACAAQLSLSYSLSSGAYGIHYTIAFPILVGSSLIIGIGEAIITTGIISYITHTSPNILTIPKITLRSKEEVSVND